MALNITRGIQKSAQKVILYGVEGIGKSTLASKFPDPLFIDTEGSTGHLDVARLETPLTWSMLLEQVNAVKSERPCKTLVIDTADWAERLCIDHVVKGANNPKVKSIEDFGYGQGYTKLVEEFGRLLDLLSSVARSGINVVLTAHSDIRKFEQPDEAASYDRYELKLSKSGQKKVAPLVKEWADAVLFLNYETIVETVSAGMGQSKGKARGGTKRVMHCTHNACWDAKNRWGLPDKVPMEYDQIAAFVPSDLGNSKVKAAAEKDVFAEALEAERQLKEIKKELLEEEPKEPTEVSVPAEALVPVEPTAPLSELEGLAPFWDPLLQLMKADDMSLDELRAYAVRKGHLTETTSFQNYPEEYIATVTNGWATVKQNILENREAA